MYIYVLTSKNIVGMWKTVFFSGLRISLCLSLTGFLFEDNKTSKRWVNDNGEIIYGLPLWYENIGYVLYLNGIIDIDYW